jgi:heptosyltransferase II
VTRILVVAPNWVGDTLLAQPLLVRLKRRFPEAMIDALAPCWTAPLLARMPEICTVIETPFEHSRLQLRERWRLGLTLREAGYHKAFVLPNTFKSALVPFFARIPLRVGYVGELRYGLLNVLHTLSPRKLSLMAERYAQLAESPGESVVRPLERSALNVDQTNLVITMSRLGLNRQRPVVAFCPGAEFGPAKRWPARHFAQLASRLAALGRAVWLIGSRNDRELGEDIARLSRGCAINLCGRTDLASAVDLLSVADLVISNDSGLMHVAAALDKSLIALYGSSSPEHTPPLSAGARIVRIDGLPCSPCYRRKCPLGHFRCMNDLSPDRVLEEIAKIEAA